MIRKVTSSGPSRGRCVVARSPRRVPRRVAVVAVVTVLASSPAVASVLASSPAAAGSLLTGSAGIAVAPVRSAAPAATQEVDLEEYPLTSVEDLPEKYRDWLNEVGYIITDDEREVFLRCETDDKRDAFIEEFWRNRDPTPGTPANEYKDLHYERWKYVNRHFGRDTPRPGWRTDQGRMYILLGEPMNIKRLPNEQLSYPIELWFYHADPQLGIPPFFYLMFYKDRGVGEYRMYSPVVDGPMKLLNPAGEQEARRVQTNTGMRGRMPTTGFGELGAAYDVLQQVDAEVATASLSLIPGDQGSAQMGMASLRSDMMLGQIQDIPNRIMPNATWAYRFLTGATEAEVRFETLPLDAAAVGLLDPSGRAFIHYGLQSQGGRLNLRTYTPPESKDGPSEERYYLTFGLAGSLTDSRQRVLKDLGEQTLQADLEQKQAAELRAGPLVYLDRQIAPSGEFGLDLVMENNVTHEFGRVEFDIAVPRPHPSAVSSSPPVVCRDHRRIEEWDRFSLQLPFQVGKLSILPALDGRLYPDDSPCVFHQVYLPRGHAAPVEVRYRVERRGSTVLEKTVWIEPSEADGNGTVNRIVELDVAGIEPGEYELAMDLVDDLRGEFRAPLHLAEPDPERPKAFVHARPQPPASDPEISLDLARQLRALGETEHAIAILRDVLSREPEYQEAVELQMQLLMEAGRYAELDALLAPKLVERPNDVDLLMTLAEANFNLGNHYDAIRYYERARLAGRTDEPEILNNLAAAYYADGRPDKARELLERSLELRPDQPEVRRLLDRVVRGAGG